MTDEFGPLADRAREPRRTASPPALLVRHWQMQASDNAMVSNARHLTVIASTATTIVRTKRPNWNVRYPAATG